MGENAKRLLPLNEEMLVSRRRIEEKYENKTFPRWKVHKIRFSVRSSHAKLLLERQSTLLHTVYVSPCTSPKLFRRIREGFFYDNRQ